MPPLIATIVSAGKATLHELQSVYGTEDAHNLLEIIMVDAHNRRVMNKQAEEDGDRN